MPCAMRDSIAALALEADLASDPVNCKRLEFGSALEQINEHLSAEGLIRGASLRAFKDPQLCTFLRWALWGVWDTPGACSCRSTLV